MLSLHNYIHFNFLVGKTPLALFSIVFLFVNIILAGVLWFFSFTDLRIYNIQTPRTMACELCVGDITAYTKYWSVCKPIE